MYLLRKELLHIRTLWAPRSALESIRTDPWARNQKGIEPLHIQILEYMRTEFMIYFEWASLLSGLFVHCIFFYISRAHWLKLLSCFPCDCWEYSKKIFFIELLECLNGDWERSIFISVQVPFFDGNLRSCKTSLKIISVILQSPLLSNIEIFVYNNLWSFVWWKRDCFRSSCILNDYLLHMFAVKIYGFIIAKSKKKETLEERVLFVYAA